MQEHIVSFLMSVCTLPSPCNILACVPVRAVMLVDAGAATGASIGAAELMDVMESMYVVGTN